MVTKRTLLFPFLRQHRPVALLTVVAGLTNSVVTLLLPLSLGRFYEHLFGTSNRGRLLDSLGLHVGHTITSFFGLLGGLILAKTLLDYAEERLTGYLSEQLGRSLRERLFAHQLAVPLATHQQKAVGKYLLRYGSDFRSIRHYVVKGMLLFVRDGLFLTLALGMLAWLNAPLTALLLVSALPFLLTLRWVNRRLEVASRQRRDVRSANLAYVASRLGALPTVKVFNREPLEDAQFRRRSAQFSAAERHYVRWRSLRNALLPLTTFVLIGVLLAGIWQAPGRVDGGTLIAFLLLVLNLRPVIRRLLRVGSIWQAGHLSFASLTALLSQPTEGGPAETDYVVDTGTINVVNLTFGYEPDRPVLSNLSFTARPGRLTHLVGGLAAGKTTLLSLLLKLRLPQQGHIWYDGWPLTTLSARSVRKAVTLVSDDVPLLGRTVFEAISYSRKTQKRDRAGELLARVQAVMELTTPVCLDDPLDDGGRNLSAGQRRALLLTRALLTRKPILLLDEPFAGLSASATYTLGQWLNQLAQERTVLLVTQHNVVGLAVGQTIRLTNVVSTPQPSAAVAVA